MIDSHPLEEFTSFGSAAPIVDAAEGYVQRQIGNKEYELKDHLGNVRLVLTDAKKMEDFTFDEATSTLDYTLGSEVKMYKDYYPFGMEMEMPEKNSLAEKYRYGFNGKENDREWGTAGLTQDYGFRLYNPALGKFLSVDPLAKTYPMLTPYQFASNTPIEAIDLDGLEAEHTVRKGEYPYSIAEQYDGVSPQDIADANPDIFPEGFKEGTWTLHEGNELIIPEPHKTGDNSPITIYEALPKMFNELLGVEKRIVKDGAKLSRAAGFGLPLLEKFPRISLPENQVIAQRNFTRTLVGVSVALDVVDTGVNNNNPMGWADFSLRTGVAYAAVYVPPVAAVSVTDYVIDGVSNLSTGQSLPVKLLPSRLDDIRYMRSIVAIPTAASYWQLRGVHWVATGGSYSFLGGFWKEWGWDTE